MITLTFLIRWSLVVAAACGTVAHAAEPQDDGVRDAPAFVLNEHRIANFQPIIAPTLSEPSSFSGQSYAMPVRSAVSLGRERVLPWIRLAEARYRLPTGLLDALIATESAYLPFAVSSAGAAGLAQLMPRTAAELGVSNRYDPVQSIDGGARYLRRMLDRFGSVSLALAAYNSGPGTVAQARGVPSNQETVAYVGRVLSRWLSLQRRS